MRFSLDIETACNITDCPGGCKHALDPFKNKITVIGLYNHADSFIFRDLDKFKDFISDQSINLIGHNLKFDLLTLDAHGVEIELDRWVDDTLLMATAYSHKVSPEYLEAYEAKRRELNKDLPKGKGHRDAGASSLKTLAPYFLGVDPFWESTVDHNNDEYVLKDAQYTYQLWEMFNTLLKEPEENYDFYRKLFDWNKLLFKMTKTGIAVDLDLVKELQQEAEADALECKRQLDIIWAPAYEAYLNMQKDTLWNDYMTKFEEAKEKSKDKSEEKAIKIFERYSSLYEKARDKLPTKLNLDSPAQLKWLLQTYFKLDITDFHDDESTGKPVLKRLSEGRDDIKLFLEYRSHQKLATAFFPSYLDMQHNGRIHANFSPFIARTGRLSSSNPNLQQVPGALHKIFTASSPDYVLITKDQSAVEPRLAAYATEDSVLFSIFDQGLDFHGYNAKLFFNLDCDIKDIKKLYPKEREVAKEVGLAILYGAGALRLQESAQKRGFHWDIEECRDRVRNFRNTYEAVYEYKYRLDETLKAGGVVSNMFGRPFRIEKAEDVHMKGFNTLIQGSASDLVWNSAYRMQKDFDNNEIDARVLLLVHDEIVVECHKEIAPHVDRIMEACMTDYRLETKHGLIKLTTEGKTSFRWEK